jgi:acyl carrier protein
MYLEVSTMLLKLFPSLDSTSMSTCNTIGEIVAVVPPSQTDSCGPNSPVTATTTDSKVDTGKVLTLLANVLGMDETNLRPDDDLHALGLDSLTSIEALHLIQNEFGVTFPNDFLQTVRTPREIEAQLQKTDTPTADAGSTLFEALLLDRPFVPIQVSQNSSATPLFLIHDGSGLVYYYEGLSGLGRSVSGIHNPRFMTSDPWDGVSAMADAYAKIVEAECPSKPVLLGGMYPSFSLQAFSFNEMSFQAGHLVVSLRSRWRVN